MKYKISDLRVDALSCDAAIDQSIALKALKQLNIPPRELAGFQILSKSIDSRKVKPILVYSLVLDLKHRIDGLDPCDEAMLKNLFEPELELESAKISHPIVVGTGPAGIFCALALAKAGAKPVVLDYGAPVAERCCDYEEFLRTRELKEDSNLLIGEGGAGTFSDGKLYSGTKDPRSRYVLKTLVDAGAPAEILYDKRPHIGSDKLKIVCAKLRQMIVELGGEFRFHSQVTDIAVKDGAVKGVILASGEKLEAPAVMIAPGLGGRKLVQTLSKHAQYELKPFQIGCRIEHEQSFLDRTFYHQPKRPASLGAAEYHIVSRPEQAPGVSSFCMCPGGEVLNASAWRGHSLTNGMSNYQRNQKFGNSCLIVTLPPDKFGKIDECYDFLADLERQTFLAGGSDYSLVAQDAAGFLTKTKSLKNSESSVRTNLVSGRIDRMVPEELFHGLRSALKYFDRHYPGFVQNGKLIGIESCVSAPVRFTRTESNESSVKHLYLGGEGVGAAGGIMSAAVDGLKLAQAILQNSK